jgi:hypothetical protein
MRRTSTRQRAGYLGSCTNQTGLNMSGGSNGVGRKGTLVRYIGSRVQQNQKYCGPVMYQGQIWSTNTKPCVKKAPRGQSFNSGVGHINTPRFSCNKNCSTDNPTKYDPEQALRLLKQNLDDDNGSVVLLAPLETLLSDGVVQPNLHFLKHYHQTSYGGTPEYRGLKPNLRQAVDCINNLKIKGSLEKDGPLVEHVVGYATWGQQAALHKRGYGVKIHIGNIEMRMFSACTYSCPGDESTCTGLAAEDGFNWNINATVEDCITSSVFDGANFFKSVDGSVNTWKLTLNLPARSGVFVHGPYIIRIKGFDNGSQSWKKYTILYDTPNVGNNTYNAQYTSWIFSATVKIEYNQKFFNDVIIPALATCKDGNGESWMDNLVIPLKDYTYTSGTWC